MTCPTCAGPLLPVALCAAVLGCATCGETFHTPEDAMTVTVNLIRVDRSVEAREVEGGAKLFGSLYPLLDCQTIEMVAIPTSPESLLLVDEDGLMRNRPTNPLASTIAGRMIVGDAALVAKKLVR
jgi:hypothetical protein